MSVEKARNRVRGALNALGGLGTPASSVVWNLIGLEQSISVVAGAGGASRKKMSGLLLGALAKLAEFYFPLSQKRN
jgi:hypothetical protein